MIEALNFVNLDRRFKKLDLQGKPEDAALDSYTAALLGREPALGWKELLERERGCP